MSITFSPAHKPNGHIRAETWPGPDLSTGPAPLRRLQQELLTGHWFAQAASGRGQHEKAYEAEAEAEEEEEQGRGNLWGNCIHD